MTISRTARRRATAILSLSVAGVMLAACGSSSNAGSDPTGKPTATGVKKGLTVYFIPKDTQNPYEVLADQGGKKALEELGGKVVVSSGTADTAAAQIPSIQTAIQKHADAIVIAGNDPSALCPSLNQASAAGIKIVSFDSDISCGTSPNHLFINQADTADVGTSEVDLLAKQIGSTGQVAILSAAASATNQNAWIGFMKKQLTKYPNMKLVSTVYGNDDPATSLTVLQGLLSAYPNLKGIISPTTVGISTAAQYLSNHKDVAKKVTLTGLGLPSQMKSYVKDGTVKSFELWNPNQLGYLAGYAAASLASGSASLQTGSTFKAGTLGSYKVLAPASGVGPSVVLGPPTVFDASNVDKFNF
ncbi:monosaccharide ABC transporter substrate-binding protein, CUT2 family [Actinacidiphila yanglinensis]|uniref:Monosaccharide ABC transporter substrate-binding protein, CUT2 family n=1 Tax=Actinacidiphila yanglinensis TaxID=310779 RepID=A0A1H6CTW0_9ACTN|nr:substrate-binding domain-containing protein [Actinacidiphila yanglinensis]SEG75975.1 monosaccharide ABC transporter substrate-binding protein, CUT2 family [Actinacidiphila yanglinensis]